MKKYDLVQDMSKTIGLSPKDVKEIYETFHFEDRLDEKLKDEVGISGIFENGKEKVKIVLFDNTEYPGLLVYKGSKGMFFKEFSKFLVELGGDIAHVVDREDIGEYEVLFRRRKNLALSSLLGDALEERKVLTENFLRKVKAEKLVGNMNSVEFIEGWISMINKWGTITDKSVIKDVAIKI
jgi:hypothetical protein